MNDLLAQFINRVCRSELSLARREVELRGFDSIRFDTSTTE